MKSVRHLENGRMYHSLAFESHMRDPRARSATVMGGLVLRVVDIRHVL